jgi:hypothetical protein
MAAPTSLLGNARAFARDFPRDKMPPGYLWDVVDYVPSVIDAQLTGRGGWLWSSTAMGGDPEAGIVANFISGPKVLVQATDGHLYEIDQTTPFAVHDRGAVPRAKQNPIQLFDTVVHFDKSGASAPKLITAPGGVITVGPIAAGHLNSPVGTVWKQRLATAGAPGEENVVRFSDPNYPLTDINSYDGANAFVETALPVMGMAGMRSVMLVFHSGSVERIRGSNPDYEGVPGDLFLEPLFDRVGCTDTMTITNWNDSCVFADEHGVHMTDGSIVRNLVSQGGILYFWRQLYENKLSMCGNIFLDYYVITVRRSDAVPPTTLVCDLNKRQWFRFSNIDALFYFGSSGADTMERLWAGLAGTGRLAKIHPCFFPSLETVAIKDDDGDVVLPVFETPWYRLGEEGRKRSRFAYLSYDARVPPALRRDAVPAGWRFGGEEEGYPPPLAALATIANQQVLSLGYIRSPQEKVYTAAGTFPDTDQYTRYRLPLGQNSYGIAFRVAQQLPTSVTRIFDLGVEAQAGERSRV